MNDGKVWLVGAGPGNPELLTLGAVKAIKNAQVVLYDSLVGAGILSLMPDLAKLIDVGKRAGHAAMAQDEINRTLLREALRGHRVVRLKGGDPFLFGRGGEELELLREHNVPFEIVPGVTSAVSVPAFAGIPVTHRDYCSSVMIITGHRKPGEKLEIDFLSLVKLGSTLVFLMGHGAKRIICEGLINAGMHPGTPAAIIENGTTAAQRSLVSTVAALPDDAEQAGIKTPAIIVIGDVASLSGEFGWQRYRPLSGVRIITTRPRELTVTMYDRLSSLGAEVISVPTIKTVPIKENATLDTALKKLDIYSWLVFTSRAGVDVFFDKLVSSGIDIRALSGLKIAAIGSGTEKALRQRGLFCQLVPKSYNAAELARSLCEQAQPGERLFIARAKQGSEGLTSILSENSTLYDDIPVYETVYNLNGSPALNAALTSPDSCRSTLITFTSASTVRGFTSGAEGHDFSKLTAVCIGHETEREAMAHGFKTIVSDISTVESMVEKILSEFGREEND